MIRKRPGHTDFLLFLLQALLSACQEHLAGRWNYPRKDAGVIVIAPILDQKFILLTLCSMALPESIQISSRIPSVELHEGWVDVIFINLVINYTEHSPVLVSTMTRSFSDYVIGGNVGLKNNVGKKSWVKSFSPS